MAEAHRRISTGTWLLVAVGALATLAVVLFDQLWWPLPPRAARPGSPGSCATTARGRAHRVLFVGNSLSYRVPEEVCRLAAVAGLPVHVEGALFASLTLGQHLANPETAQRIRDGRWDTVVLQEQSELPLLPEPQRRRRMHPSVKVLAEAARQGGAKPVLYLTWADRVDDYEALQGRIEEAVRAAAAEARAAVVPVGLAWRRVRSERPALGLALYEQDGHHQGPAGVRLAGAVFFAALFDRNPGELGVDPLDTDAAWLRQVAWETVEGER
jgi:hypothetical protein